MYLLSQVNTPQQADELMSGIKTERVRGSDVPTVEAFSKLTTAAETRAFSARLVASQFQEMSERSNLKGGTFQADKTLTGRPVDYSDHGLIGLLTRQGYPPAEQFHGSAGSDGARHQAEGAGGQDEGV